MSSPPVTAEFHHGAYTIQQAAARPLPQRFHPRTVRYTNLMTWALWFSYTLFQLNFVRLLQNETPIFLWRMWTCLLAEICLTVQEAVLALNLLLFQFAVQDTPGRPCYRLTGASAPTVDVFVTCCGEPLDVVADTVAAAGAQDYPPQQLRVFILDDGRSEQLRDAVGLWNTTSAKKHGPQIHYLSRKPKPGGSSHFKAGNLRFGLEETRRLGGSEFVASLDADMIPEPDWLRRLIPHLILEDGLAMACPPQYYYNLPDDDPLAQQTDFDVLFTIVEPLNDRFGATMCTGTGFVVRRSALEDIGGWPLAEAGEDLMCSSTLSNAGWKIAFVGEALQHGLAPESLRAHVKQKQRWIDSDIEVHKRFGFYLPGFLEPTSKMTWGLRVVGISMALRDYAPITNMLSLILLPIAIFPSQTNRYGSIVSEHSGSWSWLRSLFLVAYLARKLNNFVLYSNIGLQRLAILQSLDIWWAPYTATRSLLSLLPAAFNPIVFESSGSMLSAANERSRHHRTPLPYRLLRLDFLYYLLYIIYASIPLLLHLAPFTPADQHYAPPSLFPGAMIKLLLCIWRVSVPLRYILSPPTVPERGKLMEPDGRGGRRPKKRLGPERGSEGGGVGVGVSWVDMGEMFLIWWCYFG